MLIKERHYKFTNPTDYWTCDIETTGLIGKRGECPERIHIIVAENLKTGIMRVFDTQEDIYKKFPKFAKTVGMWIGHNFLSYDRYILNTMIPNVSIAWESVIDTLILSRLFNPIVTKEGWDKKKNKAYTYNALKRGRHSLDLWGSVLGSQKQVHEDWTTYTPAMRSRCITDVKLNRKVYHYLMSEGSDFSEESIRVEHSSTYIGLIRQHAGFQIDVPRAARLLEKITERRDILREAIDKESCSIYRPKYMKKVRRNKDGSMHGADLAVLKRSKFKKHSEEHYLIYEELPFNIKSPKQIVLHLNRAGWSPTVFTKAGAPKLCEENLNTLVPDAPKAYQYFAEYNMCKARVENIESWFDSMCSEGKVHGTVLSIGAATHRMAHRYPNTANIAGVQSPYGAECRACWIAEDPDNYHVLGTDASGIQLRLVAHYVDDEEYTKGICGDAHTTHQHILGLKTRAEAKTFIYAWLFGAGNARIGSILGGGAKEGEAAVKLFEARVPGLVALKERRERVAKARRMLGVDGRYIPVPSMHLSLPAFLQGGEQSVMKLAEEIWFFKAKELGYDFTPSANVHDEWQTRCNNNLIVGKTKPLYFASKEEAEAYEPVQGQIWTKPKKVKDNHYIFYRHLLGELQVKAIREAGELLSLNCPLDGEYIVGKNWLDTH